jgi:general bacterial porin, GBP family
MKKTLLATSLLAAFGAASAQVQIDGLLDVGVQSISGTNTEKVGSQTKKNWFAHNGSGTSQFNIRGSEALTGGLRAIFRLEADFNPAASSTLDQSAAAPYYTGTLFNGEQFVGLSGAFGSVKLGTPNAESLNTNLLAVGPFGTALGGSYNGTSGRGVNFGGLNQFFGNPGVGTRIIRSERTAKFESANYGGFGFSAEYAFLNKNNTNTGTTATSTSNNNTNGYAAIGAKFAKGPLALAATQTSIKAPSFATTGYVLGAVTVPGTATASGLTAGNSGTAGIEYKETDLAGSYDLGVAKIHAGYVIIKSKNIVAPTTYGTTKFEDSALANVTVVLPFGANRFMINATQVNDKSFNNKDRTSMGLGYDYSLSPRTSLYGRYEAVTFKDPKNTSINLVGATVAPTSYKQNTAAFGVRHAF